MNTSISEKASLARATRPRLRFIVIVTLLSLLCLVAAGYLNYLRTDAKVAKTLPQLQQQASVLKRLSLIIHHADLVAKSSFDELMSNHQALLDNTDGSGLPANDIKPIQQIVIAELSRLVEDGSRNRQIANQAQMTIENGLVLLAQINGQIEEQLGEQNSGPEAVLSISAEGQLKSAEQWGRQLSNTLNLLRINLASLPRPSINPQLETTRALVSQLELLTSQLPIVDSLSEGQTQLVLQIDRISAVFLSGDTLLGKWQGTTKRFNAYKDIVQTLGQQANLAIIAQTADSQSESSDIGSSYSLILTPDLRINLDLQLTTYALLGGSLFFFLFSVTLSILLHRKLLAAYQTTQLLVSDLAENKPVKDVEYIEQQQVVDTVNIAFSGQVTLKEVDVMQEQHSNLLTQLAACTQAVGFELNESGLTFSTLNGLKNILELEDETEFGKHAFNSRLNWQRLLGRGFVKGCIDLAKQAKAEGEEVVSDYIDSEKGLFNVTLKLQSNEQQTILPAQESGLAEKSPKKSGVSGLSFFGAMAKALEVKHLRDVLAETQEAADNNQTHALLKTAADHQQLTKHLIQAMLQCQSNALTFGDNIQGVYQPLTRLFDWARQQQISTQLAIAGARSFQQVAIHQLLAAISANVTSYYKRQQNSVVVDIDKQLQHQVQINIRLLTRLITALCQRMLKQQSKTKLLFSVDVVDQDVGQQRVKLTMSLPKGNQYCDTLLNHLNALVIDQPTASKDEHQSTPTKYILSLLTSLHANDIDAVSSDENIAFSCTIPVTLLCKPIEDQNKRLANRHVAIVANDVTVSETIASTLSVEGADLERLADVEVFTQTFDLARLKREKLDALVVSGLSTRDIQLVEAHIKSLPKNIQPVITVVQDANASLVNQGLYSLSELPFLQNTLVEEVYLGIKEKRAINRLLPVESFAEIQFMPAQVEVLFAVKSFEQHHVLWRLLVWLGYRVTVVVDANSMLKHWQTGRYLILFNEFDCLPFVAMQAGTSVARGVFSFSQEPVLALEDEQAEIAKHWQLGVVPELLDVPALTKLLSGWLSKKTREDHVRASAQQLMTHRQADAPEMMESVPAAFDLVKFSEHQGSPELAALMIDEYLDELSEGILMLIEQIAKRSPQGITDVIAIMEQVAIIMAAPALIQCLQQLRRALQNKAYSSMQRLTDQLRYEVALVKSFADTI